VRRCQAPVYPVPEPSGLLRRNPELASRAPPVLLQAPVSPVPLVPPENLEPVREPLLSWTEPLPERRQERLRREPALQQQALPLQAWPHVLLSFLSC